MACFLTLGHSFVEAMMKSSHMEASALCKMLRTIRMTFMEVVRVFQPNNCFHVTNKLGAFSALQTKADCTLTPK